jgi:hypothetical protein
MTEPSGGGTMRVAVVFIALLIVVETGVGGGAALPIPAQDATPARRAVTAPEQNVDLVRRSIEMLYDEHDPQAAAKFLASDVNRSNPARAH